MIFIEIPLTRRFMTTVIKALFVIITYAKSYQIINPFILIIY